MTPVPGLFKRPMYPLPDCQQCKDAFDESEIGEVVRLGSSYEYGCTLHSTLGGKPLGEVLPNRAARRREFRAKRLRRG